MKSVPGVFAAFVLLVTSKVPVGRAANDDLIPPAEKQLPAGLQKCAVAHFPFDGHGRETLSGIETTAVNVEYADGKIGKAAVFNGKNALVVVRDDPKLHFKDSFSIAFWIWCQNEVKSQTLVAKTGFRNDQYSVAILKDLQLVFVFNNRDSWKTAQQRLSKRKWEHVVVTGTSRQNARVFFNGKEDRNSPFPTAHGFDDNPFRLAFGSAPAERAPGDDFLEGLLDDVWFFNRALTPEEVTSVYRMGRTLPKGQHQVRARLPVPTAPAIAFGGLLAVASGSAAF